MDKEQKKYPRYTKDQNLNCKLNDTDIRDIRKRRKAGYVLREIAAIYNVSENAIKYHCLTELERKMVVRKRWEVYGKGKETYNKESRLKYISRKKRLQPKELNKYIAKANSEKFYAYDSDYSKKYYNKNKERLNKNAKKYRDKNRIKNKESLNKKAREYREKNKDRLNKIARENYIGKRSEYRKEYHAKNKELLNKRARERYAIKKALETPVLN